MKQRRRLARVLFWMSCRMPWLRIPGVFHAHEGKAGLNHFMVWYPALSRLAGVARLLDPDHYPHWAYECYVCMARHGLCRECGGTICSAVSQLRAA